jgi:hypothetical protein
MDFFFVSPEMNVDVNDNLNCKESGPYRDLGSANSYVSAKSTNSDIRESNLHYTMPDIDNLRIGDEEIVQKAVLGIQDRHSNTERPGKLLASNISSPKLRYVFVFYMIYAAFKKHIFAVIISLVL